MQVQALSNTATAEDIVEVLQQDGCVIVRNLVPDSLLDAIYAELKPFIEATKVGGDDFAGYRTQRTGSLVARSQSFHQLALHLERNSLSSPLDHPMKMSPWRSWRRCTLPR